MADANQANYGKIGFTLIMGIACIVGTLIWFGGAGSGKHYVAAETYFNSPVSGLAVGNDVCFRGVKIGTVKRISFIATEYENYDPDHGRAIWVGLAVDPRLCGFDEHDKHVDERLAEIVSKGLHATLAANILTGIAHIELNFPKMAIKDDPISWKPRNLCIPPAPTLLESASDALPGLIAKLDKVNISAGWSNVMDVVISAGTLMGSANTVIETQQGNLAEIMSNIRDASSALRDLSYQLRDNPSLLIRSADQQALPETSK